MINFRKREFIMGVDIQANWLAVEALLKDDMAKVLAVLQQGLASSEHADFVKRFTE